MARRLHLIDIENLACDPLDAHGIAQERLKQYLDAAWQPGDLVTIASNARLWNRLAWSLTIPHRYIVPPAGRHGADRALLECAAGLDLDTFDGVGIGSGDHAFTGLAKRASASGLHVSVVANGGTIAHSLSEAADTVHELRSVPAATSRAGRVGSADRSSMVVERLPRRRAHSFSARPPRSSHEARKPGSGARPAGDRGVSGTRRSDFDAVLPTRPARTTVI